MTKRCLSLKVLNPQNLIFSMWQNFSEISRHFRSKFELIFVWRFDVIQPCEKQNVSSFTRTVFITSSLFHWIYLGETWTQWKMFLMQSHWNSLSSINLIYTSELQHASVWTIFHLRHDVANLRDGLMHLTLYKFLPLGWF